MKAILSILFILFVQNIYADDMRYYDVEVVVIENLKSRSHTDQSENWPVDVTLNQDDKTVQLGQPVPAEWLPVGVDPKASYTLIDPAEYKLTSEVEKISGSKNMRVIYHTAWRQPGLDKDSALAVHFIQEVPPAPEEESSTNQAGSTETPEVVEHKSTPSELEGIFKITLARYLHFFGEMTLRDKNPVMDTQQAITDNPFSSQENNEEPNKEHVIYFKQERRRIRSNELHYLDHPVISMLLKITPYEKPEEQQKSASGSKMPQPKDKIKR